MLQAFTTQPHAARAAVPRRIVAQAAATATVKRADVPLELEEIGLPMNTYGPKNPFIGKIVSVKTITGPKATGACGGGAGRGRRNEQAEAGGREGLAAASLRLSACRQKGKASLGIQGAGPANWRQHTYLGGLSVSALFGVLGCTFCCNIFIGSTKTVSAKKMERGQGAYTGT